MNIRIGVNMLLWGVNITRSIFLCSEAWPPPVLTASKSRWWGSPSPS